jgi:uncharacterized membrane protein
MSEMPPSYTPPPGGGSYTPPPPPPPPPIGGGAPAGGDRGLMLFLSYFGIFALIPLLTKKEDPEIQWHAKNGLALAIAWVVVAIGWQIVGFVLPLPIRLIWGTLGCFIGLAFLVLDILAMVKAFGGQRMRLPVITDMAEKMFGNV